jgi:hypothetical protein
MTWREYHEFTKHTAQALRRTPHVVDWENIPDPFHYEGVPVLDLPADPPSPEIPVFELLRGARGSTPAARPVAINGKKQWNRPLCAQGRCATRLRHVPTEKAALILDHSSGSETVFPHFRVAPR